MLKAHLKAYQLLSDNDIALCEQLAQPRLLKKGEFFIKEGQVCHEIAFVNSGILRSYYHSSALEEVTYCFPLANNFVTAYSSFLQQTPSAENIQALTDVKMLSIPRRDVQLLEDSSVNWLRFLKLKGEQEFIAMEKRVFLLQRESAETRYEQLINTQPELLQLVPLKYLSSYLGVTERHLSRIRKSVFK